MITKFLALGLVSFSLACAAAEPSNQASGQPALTAALHRDQGLLDLSFRGRRILLYAFATNQFKPYVRELYTLKGENILVDAPPDHLHHHGLMYAIRVNGVNFWEERDQPGYQRSVDLTAPVIDRSPDGLPRASFTQTLHWVAMEHAQAIQTAPAALLVEKRTLTLTVDEVQQEVALSWKADFAVGRGAAKVVLSGASYHGLGFRLPSSFSLVAQHQNSEGAPYPTQGTGDVTPARWSSVSHSLGGHDVTLAMFGQRASHSELPVFFSMVKPFTYLSVTQALDRQQREYAAGNQFSLDYLLVVYPERKTPEFIEKRYRRWSK